MSCKHVHTNVYLPSIAIIDEIREEIKDVKTFFWHFEDPAAETIFRSFMPGQFAMVSIFGAGEMAISLPPSPTEDKLFFTTRAVGTATNEMHKLKVGNKFAVRGPYGNGFPMKDYENRNLIIVAGGIGLIPLRSVIIYALHNRSKFGKIQVFYGSGSEDQLLFKDSYAKWTKVGVKMNLIFDKEKTNKKAIQGASCDFGLITKLFDTVPVVKDATAFVCGPEIMFKFSVEKLKKVGFTDQDIYLSLERKMHCGIGICQHCATGEFYVCKNGPVFRYDEVAGKI